MQHQSFGDPVNASSDRTLWMLRWAQGLAVLGAVLIAALIVTEHRQHRQEVAHQAYEQKLLKMEAVREHAEEYFDQIRMHLRFISLDNDVVRMTRESHDYIKAIYEENYARHQMSEIYVIERDFDGTHRPFMTFEHGDEHHDVDELHSLEKEKHEYRTQMEHIRRFAEEPSRQALISRPLPLCTNEIGVVLSVPIRSGTELVGIVSGMVPSAQIARTLEWDNFGNMVVLVNERGDFFSCEDLPEETRAWFQARFLQNGIASFFEGREETFPAERYTSQWTTADIPGGQRWYLAFMYDEAAYLQVGGIRTALSRWGTVGMVLLLGATALALSRTLSKRLLAQEQVRKLLLAVEQIPVSVVITDTEGTIEYVNPKFTKVTGYTAEEAIGKNPRVLKSGDMSPDVYRQMWETIRAGKTWRGELHNKRKNGELFWEWASISPVRGSNGEITHFVAVKEDITRRKQADEELRQAKEEAEAANQELKAVNMQLEHAIERANRMAVQAEIANIAKSQFLANMSHEIRTPMTAILGYADVMSEGLTDPVSIDAVRTIKRNGQHLLELINDILDLSKVESGKMTVENQRCDPMQLIGDVAASLRPRAEVKNIHLDVKYAGAIPRTICTDPTRLRQALMNLVGNAIKFTSQGGVTIRVGLLGNKSGPELLIEVVDTGIGVPPGRLNAIFEPFEQADSSTTREFGGTGLGLTISKRIADLLGGGLEVQSEVGKGSVFSLRVTTGPLDGVEMIDQPVDEAGSSYEAEKQCATGELDCRILLVEDGPDNQRLIAFVLKKAGANVEVADNGKIGADLALAGASEGQPFDIILMDMQMPVMDGYEATALLRRKGYTGPIIALTAHAMDGDRQKCIDAGCDDYASKPIDRRKLIAAIQRHHASKAGSTRCGGAIAELHGSEVGHG